LADGNRIYRCRERQIQQIFNKIYKKYDLMNSLISFGLHKAWRRDIIKHLEIEEGAKILDLCCGTAECTIALARKTGPRGKVYGLDFSENMLMVAREKIEKLKLQNIKLLYGNARELPFEDDCFNYAVIAFGLRNTADYMQVIKEMYRVVKSGGKAVCLDTAKPALLLFTGVYSFYMRTIVPVLGALFAHNAYREYAWLGSSMALFPDRHELTEMFYRAGFKDIKVKAYCGGVAVMHLGCK
jgi:demethylmenaquinone methyltransferase/2-methoxy-6-polyprenyl-1,4-benzoquinol methylase